jgi:hypothetical protein
VEEAVRIVLQLWVEMAEMATCRNKYASSFVMFSRMANEKKYGVPPRNNMGTVVRSSRSMRVFADDFFLFHCISYNQGHASFTLVGP